MYGIEDVGFATPVFAEETNCIFTETELCFMIVTKILETEAAEEHDKLATGRKLQATGLTSM